LSLNRQGPHAFAEANQVLVDVADHGPTLFRGKAHVALATNLRIAGDDKAALELYGEAARAVGPCEHGKPCPVFLAAFQCALIRYDEGDYRGALADLERLEPLAWQVRFEQPALLHNYYNSLAVFLIANGRLSEASPLQGMLLTSPFLNAYPEWQKTCADIALRTQPRSRSFLSMSIDQPFAGEPEALTESCGESLRHAEIAATLLLVKVICHQPRCIPIRLLSGRFLRRPFVAARNHALSPRHIRAYLRPLRWSYPHLYPTYPRPPNA
jgi:hypothetical protein